MRVHYRKLMFYSFCLTVSKPTFKHRFVRVVSLPHCRAADLNGNICGYESFEAVNRFCVRAGDLRNVVVFFRLHAVD